MADSYADEIDTWIGEAARENHILVRRLPEEEARAVQEQAMARYVKSPNPRVWWVNLAKRIDEHYDRNAVRMSEVLPQKRGRVFLIPEADSGQLLVYEVEASQLEILIDKCPGFEYNVLPHDFSWLFIETDHDMFYICRDHDVLPALMK